MNATADIPAWLWSQNCATGEPTPSTLTTNMLITAPMTSVPPSPMNILERSPNTLCMKNGIRAPIKAIDRMNIIMSPALKNTAENIAQAVMQKPDDKPSTPSIRFMALIMPTHANTVRGTATQSGSTDTPHKP